MKSLIIGLAAAMMVWSAAGARGRVDVFEAPIAQLQRGLANGEFTSQDLVRAYLARITAYDRRGPKLNAIITLNPRALADAAALDEERRKRGARGPLHGIPVLVKDNFATAQMPTSGGTLALATLQTKADAFQVARLRAAGAIILGKTAMHELAADITTVSSLSGYSRNPYDPDRSPGGSSGGTGAAVAASFAAAGMGTDTCGSIRIPAAYQNLFGLRPTRGLLSRHGIVPLSDTQDTPGPLARTVMDLALVLDATAGPDPSDPSTALTHPRAHPPYASGLSADGLRGARIGVVVDLVGNAPDDREGAPVFRAALAKLREAGATVVELPPLGLDDALRDSSVIAFEFREDLERFLAEQEHAPVRSLDDILKAGLDHSQIDARFRERNASVGRQSQQYRDALRKRGSLRELVLRTLAEHQLDALVYPTTLRRPPLIPGEGIAGGASCQLSAHSGLPALAAPAGFTAVGLPIGMEFLGAEFSEAKLLQLAAGWEAVARPRRPPFTTPAISEATPGPPPTITRAVPEGGGRSGSAHVRLRYDPSTGWLHAETAVSGVRPDDVIAVTLHRSNGQEPGPILGQLVRSSDASGALDVKLYEPEREALAEGGLYLRLFTKGAPLGGPPVPVQIPQTVRR